MKKGRSGPRQAASTDDNTQGESTTTPVPDYSECCQRPSWAYLIRALEAEAERVTEEVTEELRANGQIVADHSFMAIYEALGPA